MTELCGSCSYVGPFCTSLKKICRECFFETDDDGKKTKPNYKKKIGDRIYHQAEYDPGMGNGRSSRRGGPKKFSLERKIAIANDDRLASLVSNENGITISWVYNLRRMYKNKSPVA